MPENLEHRSLDDVEFLYRQGRVSETECEAYIVEWNKGPHFYRAVLRDGRIRMEDK